MQTYTHCACPGCGHKLAAEIKDIPSRTKPYRENAPVWYCKDCDLTFPAKAIENKRWVKNFNWSATKSLLRGNNHTGKTGVCLGCRRDTIIADTEITVPNQFFPVLTVLAPVWNCTTCGYSDLVMEEEMFLWAEKYKGWR